jgi:hypothetical protein
MQPRKLKVMILAAYLDGAVIIMVNKPAGGNNDRLTKRTFKALVLALKEQPGLWRQGGRRGNFG